MRNRHEAREFLRKAGISAAQLARELNVSENTVRGVLNGTIKGHFGKAHRVAVHLGMKEGVILPDGAPAKEALKLAGGAR